MEAHIQFVQTSPNDKLEQIVRDRLEKLASKYEWIIRAKVILKREKNPMGRTRSCAIELSIPGENVHQTSRAISFEMAITGAFRKLHRLLRKRKERMYQHLR